MSKEEVLTREDLRKTTQRWLIDISTFSYETQLASSTLFPVYPRSRKIYPGDEDLKKSCLNYMRYYNTIPWISPFVIGAALGIEDENGTSSLDAVNDFKVGPMRPLAGIGDTIGWAMIPTIFGSIVVSMGMEGNPLGIFLWAAFIFAFLVARILQYGWGYGMSVNIITKFGKQIMVFIKACSVLGLTMVDSLVATVVKLSTGLQFKNGDVVMKVQELIDGVTSTLLPVAVVGIIYYFTEMRRVKVAWMTLFIIMASIIGTTTGIFTT